MKSKYIFKILNITLEFSQKFNMQTLKHNKFPSLYVNQLFP